MNVDEVRCGCFKRSMHYVASAALVMDEESAQCVLVFLREARALVNRVEGKR